MKNKLIKSLGIIFITLISKTWRIAFNGRFPRKPAIIVFWHNEMMPIWRLFAHKYAGAVVSQSKDGQILSDLLDKWGFILIRGSSSKGGKEVMNQLVEKSKDNFVLLTPDGPRGPRHILKPGGIVAAQRSGTRFYFIKVNIHKKITFHKSWDKFEFPLPFSKISIEISEPYIISSELNNDEISVLMTNIEEKMR